MSLQLTPTQRERLDRLADERDRSVAYLVREAVDLYLKAQQTSVDERLVTAR